MKFSYILFLVAFFYQLGSAHLVLASAVKTESPPKCKAQIKRFEPKATPITFGNKPVMFATVYLNNKKANALIDTGATISVINENSTQYKHPTQETEKAVTSNGTVLMRYAGENSVSFSGLSVNVPKIGLLNLSDIERVLNTKIDIIIGVDILACRPFSIDFINNRFLFNTHLDNIQNVLHLAENTRVAFVYAQTTVNGHTAKMQIDTGFAGDLAFTNSWASRNLKRPDKTTTGLTMSASGLSVDELLILPEITIGLNTSKNVIARIEPASGTLEKEGLDGVIGLDYLKRFKPIFDLEKGQLSLKPLNGAVGQVKKATLGIQGLVNDKGQYKVMHVMANSPAAQFGWQVGDLICSVDGVPFKSNVNQQDWAQENAGTIARFVMCDGKKRQLMREYFY
jgi:predicted aspartyl protease